MREKGHPTSLDMKNISTETRKKGKVDEHANFELEEMRNETNFENFEQNPETAVMLYLMNSGYNCFRHIDQLRHVEKGSKEYMSMMEETIHEVRNEVLTEEECNNLTTEFLKNQGRGICWKKSSDEEGESKLYPFESRDVLLLTCASCGIREPERGREMKQVLVEKLKSFQYRKEDIERLEAEKLLPKIGIPREDGSMKYIDIWKVRSVYECNNDGHLYYLHPEMVHMDTENRPCVFLCDVCYKFCLNETDGRQYPINSIISGLDLGDYKRIGLEEPTIMERCLIAKTRLYHNVVRIQGNKMNGCRTDNTNNELRSHSIVFRHDAPIVSIFPLLLNSGCRGSDEAVNDLCKKMRELIHIEIIGPDNKIDLIAKKASQSTILQARPHIIYQWLTVLRTIHPLYKDDPQLPNFEEFKKVIKICSDKVILDAERNTSKEEIEIERARGDDVVEVRTSIYLDGDSTETKNLEPTIDTNTDANNTYSYVMKDDDVAVSIDGGKNRSSILEQIEQIADAFNVNVRNEIELCRNNLKPRFKSAREMLPQNEFTNLNTILTGTFPHVFMYGRAHCDFKRKRNEEEVTSEQKNGPNTLNNSAIRHILLQYTTVAARDRELLFYLFDYKMRHACMKNLSCKIRSNPKAFKEYASLMNSEEMKSKIKQAARNPEKKDAKEVIRLVSPFLKIGSKNTFCAPLKGDDGLSKTYAMTRRFGPASTFLTITPDDISNPTSFRLAMRSDNNVTFPATCTDDFLDCFRNNEKFVQCCEIKVPTNYSARVKAATSNPVAVALEFQSLMENIMTILIGCKPSMTMHNNSKNVKTWYFQLPSKKGTHRKGVFGHITAFYGQIETQQRGALHFHVIIYGGLCPKLLESCASFTELCEEVQKALDTMYIAEIPRCLHVQHELLQTMKSTVSARQFLPKQQMKQASLVVPTSASVKEKWLAFLYDTILETGIHQHTFTCKKLPAGAYGCRGARPSGLCEATKPVQIIEKEYNIHLDKEKHVQICTYKTIKEQEPREKRNIEVQPIPEIDKRIIVWELQRRKLESLPEFPNVLELQLTKIDMTNETNDEETQETIATAKDFCVDTMRRILDECKGYTIDIEKIQYINHWYSQLNPLSVIQIYKKIAGKLEGLNGYVIETNKNLSNLCSSSINASLLGNSQQSRSALFYLTPYLCKNKVELESCLQLLARAQQKILEYPSTANDTGTETRTTQHLLTTLINSLHNHVEVSDTQAALSLLSMGHELSSEIFCTYSEQSHVKLVEFELELHKNKSNLREYLEGMRNIYDNEEIGSKDLKNENIIECTDDTMGAATFYTVTDKNGLQKNIPVPYTCHYRLRGKELANMSRVEYYAVVGLRRINKNRIKTTDDCDSQKQVGRLKSRDFSFDSGHPLYTCYTQYLKTKQPTLIYGATIPKKPKDAPEQPPSTSSLEEMESYRQSYSMWKEEVDKYAKVCLVSFRPEVNLYSTEHDNSEPEYYSWNTFCSWIKDLENSKFLIDRLRLQCLYTSVHGMHSNPKQRAIISMYRKRNRTVWSDEELKSIKKCRIINHKERSLWDNDNVETSLEVSISPSQHEKARKVDLFCEIQMRALKDVVMYMSTDNELKTSNCVQINLQCNEIEDFNERDVFNGAPRIFYESKSIDADEIAENIKGLCVEIVPESDVCNTSNNKAKEPSINDFLSSRNLSCSQAKIITCITEYFEQLGSAHRRNHPPPVPIRILFTGDPGSGKSYVIECIREVGRLMKVGHIVCTSHYGIAAVNVDGITLTKLLNIP